MKYIIKRDGRREPMNASKIAVAIQCAMDETTKGSDGVIAWKIAEEIFDDTKDEKTVEQVEDLVLEKLKANARKDAARKYEAYRKERSRIRNKKSQFMKTISEKLTASNVQNQNANVDEASFGGRKGEAASELMRQYALDNCMSEMSKNNHLNNEIYIHDLDSYAVGQHNCLTVPMDDLLAHGFNTRQTDIRPANSINTAFQLVAVIFQIQSLQQFGGVAASHIDWTMVPYVRKSFYKHYCDGMKYLEGREADYEFGPDSPIDWSDYRIASEPAYCYAMEMTERELKQAVEGMYHNLNYRVA